MKNVVLFTKMKNKKPVTAQDRLNDTLENPLLIPNLAHSIKLRAKDASDEACRQLAKEVLNQISMMALDETDKEWVTERLKVLFTNRGLNV